MGRKQNKTPKRLADISQQSKPEKTADRPHRVTIALSLAAVMISAMSWYESHDSRRIAEQTRNINDAINRPYFEFTDLVTYPGAENREDYPFELRVKNTGRLTARDAKLSIAFYVSPFIDGRKLRQPSFTTPVPVQLAPGELTILNFGLVKKDFKSEWPGWAKLNDPGMPQSPARINLVIGGSITYRSEITDREYKEYWCFHSGEEVFGKSYEKCGPSAIQLMSQN